MEAGVTRMVLRGNTAGLLGLADHAPVPLGLSRTCAVPAGLAGAVSWSFDK
jgi:hypothetical protein